MNYRDRILRKIAGENDGVPLFVPRLDIWYNANRSRGTLPAGYEDLDLLGIANRLGVGYHSVIPDFIRNGPVEDLYHRGLGFYNNGEYVYQADFTAVDFSVEKTDEEIITTYHCSDGNIRTKVRYNQKVLESGVTLPVITEHAIKEHDDYLRCAEIFSRVKIRPVPDQFLPYRNRVGDAGLPVAYLSLACGPMQHILRDLREYQPFIFDMYDIPDLIAEMCEPLGSLYDDMLNTFVISEGQVGLFGGNYDDTLTYRPFFDEYILPWLSKAAEQFHAAGKYLLTHTDGENEALNESYLQGRFDIADSVCPAPMTKLTLEEYREIYGTGITIWGGIPSVITLASSCPYDDFKAYIDRIFESCRPYNNLIFSIADTTPADADFGRIEYIRDKALGVI